MQFMQHPIQHLLNLWDYILIPLEVLRIFTVIESQEVDLEKYAHSVGPTYTLTILLPFIYSSFSEYHFQNLQETKYSFSAKLHNELIDERFIENTTT